MHHERVDELVGVGRDQQEGEHGDTADEEGVAIELGPVGVAQANGAQHNAEGDKRCDFGVVDRQAARDDAAEGEFPPRHVAGVEEDRRGGEEDGDTADLGDELIEGAETEEWAGGEEEEGDEGKDAPEASK